MKKSLAIILALCSLLLLFTACGDNKEETETSADHNISESQPEQLKIGEEIFKDITATDLDGNEVDSSIFKGKKITMVNIWATFCRPCIGEMPDLQTISEEYADKGLQIIGIVTDVKNKDDSEMIDTAKSIVKDTGVKYISLVPSNSLNSAKLNSVLSVPETVFLDENGKQIGDSVIGSRSYQSWKVIIDSMLERLDAE